MAEFIQTMRDWKRMCNSMGQEDEYNACDKCKLRSFECPPIYERECDGADWAHVENVVTAWAEEHKEPVYPSWALWLCEQDIATIVPCFSDKRQYDATLNDIAYQPIPAEIAQKLGLKPKEDV